MLDKGLKFYFTKGSSITPTHTDDVFSFAGTDYTKEFLFDQPMIIGAKGFAINIDKAKSVTIDDGEFYHNGWVATEDKTTYLANVSQSSTDLATYYTDTSKVTNGGSVKLTNIPVVEIASNKYFYNNKPLILENCGIGGSVFYSREQIAYNLKGVVVTNCKNVTGYNIAYKGNASNGLEVTGGLNNRFALSVFESNWGSDVVFDGVANTKLRDNDLTNSNISDFLSDGSDNLKTFDSEGNVVNNKKGDIHIKGDTFDSEREFILEILDTQIHSTEPAASEDKSGIYFDPSLGNATVGNNIINIDDVGFIGFNHQIDFSDADISNLSVTLGDNRHQSYLDSHIAPPSGGNFFSLPYSNHVTKVVFPDFSLDGSATTVILKDNTTGVIINSYPVNLVHVDATTMNLMFDNKIQLEAMDRANISVNGTLLGLGTDNSTANTLNSMFERTEVGGGDVDPPSPTLTGEVEELADGDNYNSTYMELGLPDGDGNQTLISTQTGDNRGDVWSEVPMNQLGEFTQFQTDSAGGGKRFYVGFSRADQLSSLGDGSGSGHEGLQWSLAIYDGYNAPWTFYGDQSGYSYGSFFTDKEAFRVHSGITTNKVTWKVGINENDGKFYVYFWSIIDLEWKYVAKTSYSLTAGDYHAVVRFYTQGGGLYGDFTNYRFPETDPVLTWNYIESPDGVFHYPLFSTIEEAQFADDPADADNGTYHIHGFEDDTSNTIWYMPDSLMYHDQNAAPSGNTLGTFTDIVWNAIPTADDSNYIPTAFSNQTIYVNEGDLVNVQVHPTGVTNFTTTIGGIPAFTLVGGNIQGTAPEVSGDTVSNPSDTTTVTVYRTNNFGTSQGTLTIVINNLTLPTTVNGINQEGPATLTGTVANDSTWFKLDDQLSAGERLIITGTFLDDIFASMDTFDQVYIGLKDSAWSNTLDAGDYGGSSVVGFYGALYIRLYKNQNSQKFAYLNYNGNQVALGTPSFTSSSSMSGLNLFLEVTDSGNNVRGGWEYGNTDNVISTTYGNWTSNNKHQTGDQGFGITDVDISLYYDKNSSANSGTNSFDFDDTDWTAITKQNVPTASTILTSWTKALDFGGSNQHAKQVSTSTNYMPIGMDGISATVPSPNTSGNTANSVYSRPFATSVVFKIDGHGSNQHIWNQGGGVNDDNIYLRVSSSKALYFGWGRDGSGVKRMLLRDIKHFLLVWNSNSS